MADGFVQLPADSTGKKLRTLDRGTPGHDQYLALPQEMTFTVISGVSAFAASKFHLVIYNNNASYVVELARLMFLPTVTARTGAVSGAWTFRRRRSPTTAPAGGALTPVAADPNDALPANISVHNAPTTAPAGGTSDDFLVFFPNAEEYAPASRTWDLPAASALMMEGHGEVIYDSRWGGIDVKPIMARNPHCLEVQQDATAGTGEGRLFAAFTVVSV